MPPLMWTRTDPDKDDDWLIRGVGRVYRETHGPNAGKWYWSALVYSPRRNAIDTEGIEPTRDAAMAAVKQAHMELIKEE